MAGCSRQRMPEKEIPFYTIEASMSMKIHEGSCTIRENELPQMRANDTNFAQTGASCSFNWWRYSESGRRLCGMNARRALTSLAVGETYVEMTLSLFLPRPWRGRIQPLRGWRDLTAGTFRRFHLRLMILGPFGTRQKRLVQRLWAVPEAAPAAGFLTKRFFFIRTKPVCL